MDALRGMTINLLKLKLIIISYEEIIIRCNKGCFSCTAGIVSEGYGRTY